MPRRTNSWASSPPRSRSPPRPKVVERSSTIVVFELVRIAVLDGRVASHSMRFAQRLAFSSAVNVGHKSTRIAFEFLHQLVPVGFQLLAVASPGCLEFYEDAFATGLGIPSVGCPC